MNVNLIQTSTVFGPSTKDIFSESARPSLTQAINLFRPSLQASQGADDWVSFEASPLRARIADSHLGNAEQFEFLAIPLMPGIHALSKINDLRRAWAPASAGVAIYSAFPLRAAVPLTLNTNLAAS